MNHLIENQCRRSTFELNEWMEDILAGLLVCGVKRDEIVVQHHPRNRTVILVCGVQKYEWRSTHFE